MKEILQQIANLLSEDDNEGLALNMHSEGSKLWCVLTALRGPDNNDDGIKRATTAVIRRKVGIREDNSGRAIVNTDSSEYKNTRARLASWFVSSHFLEHAQNAFSALGLKWNEVNEP